jgi:hypothetical protein
MPRQGQATPDLGGCLDGGFGRVWKRPLERTQTAEPDSTTGFQRLRLAWWGEP